MLTPNYQFWKYKVNNKNVMNAFVIVKPDLPKDDIKLACTSMAQTANERVNLIIVTAFEKENFNTDYDFGYPGKRWQLLINKSKKIERFTNISQDVSEEARYAHTLGFSCLDNKQEIPNEWFGNEPSAIEFGKILWESDEKHNLIMHPFVNQVSKVFHCEVNLTRRIESSGQYQALIKEMFGKALESIKNHDVITITFSFRESVENLASLNYFGDTGVVNYKDEYMKKTKYYKVKNWMKI